MNQHKKKKLPPYLPIDHDVSDLPPSFHLQFAICTTVVLGQKDVTQTLLRLAGAPQARENKLSEVLWQAVSENHLVATINILDSGIAVDLEYTKDNTNTILGLATRNSWIGITRKLIQHGANVNGSKHGAGTPLIQAAKQGNVGMVSALIEAGANVDATRWPSGETALFYGAVGGFLPVVAKLLKNGAHVNGGPNNLRSTPLICAAGNGNIEIVAVLLQAGADVNFQHKCLSSGGHDGRHHSAVWAASKTTKNRPHIMRLLLQYGADPNQICHAEMVGSILTRAVKLLDAELVKVLIQGGAVVNERDLNHIREYLQYSVADNMSIMRIEALEIEKLLAGNT